MHRTQTGTDTDSCAQNTEKHRKYVLCTGTGTWLDTDSVHRDKLLCTGHRHRALCTGDRGTTQASVHRTGHRLLCTDTGHRTQTSVHRAQDTEHRPLCTGHRAQTSVHRHRTQTQAQNTDTGTDIEILI